MATDFATYSNGELRGCVTAIDGWVARTRKPHHREVEDIMAYRNRHGCWGLVVLAGCDARCRFTTFLVVLNLVCHELFVTIAKMLHSRKSFIKTHFAWLTAIVYGSV